MNNRKNKITKYITAVVVFILLSLCNVYFSVMLHKIFAKDATWMHFDSFFASLDMIMDIKGARLMFLTMELFIILALIAAQITRVSTYKSDLVKVTDDIYIPQKVGENQYGSARFYTKEELNNVFTVVRINKNSSSVSKLMAQGYDDLEFMK